MTYYFENQNPAVMQNGLNTQKDVSVTGYSASASAGTINIGSSATGMLSVGRTTSGTIFGGTVVTSIATQNGTPTAAQLMGGVITHASTTGAGTLTLPTGTLLSAAVTGVTTGDNYWVVYANTGSQTVTLTGATGSTIVGTAAVPTGKNAQMFLVNTGTNTWNVYCTLSA